jgi:hypothetical protein
MKKPEEKQLNRGEIAIYKMENNPEIKVKLEKDTVWLDAHQIAALFGIDRTVAVKYINNIYTTKELLEKTTCAKIAQVAADGKMRKMNIYNLDMIISVGYRVNSKKATQFRIWATTTLKDYLVKGFAINENRILQTKDRLAQLQSTIKFLQSNLLTE